MFADERDCRAYWAIEYVNGRQFMGRFGGRWTRGSIACALLFDSRHAADAALQALRGEANDRVKSNEARPIEFWWGISGGLTMVVEVERILQVKGSNE